MQPLRLFALALLLPFSVLSVYAVQQVGYWGIFEYHLPSPAGWQVFTDLVIAIILIAVWMIRNARETGRNVIPYLILSVFLGSIGPLLYLVMAPQNTADKKPAT